jgi:hypothetical protein
MAGKLMEENAAVVLGKLRSGLTEYNASHSSKIELFEPSLCTDCRDGSVEVGLKNVGVLRRYNDLESHLRQTVGDRHHTFLGERRYGSDLSATKFVRIEAGKELQDAFTEAEHPTEVVVAKRSEAGTARRCLRFCTISLMLAGLIYLIWVLVFGMTMNTFGK